MRADGSEQRRLTSHPGVDDSPSWSPDGTRIAFVSARDGGQDIHVMLADGQKAEKLTSGGLVTLDASVWSPDGTRLAYQVAKAGNYDIAVVRLADRASAVVAGSPEYDGMYSWSPDGRRLAFISGRGGSDAVWLMDSDGGRPRALTTTSSLNPQFAP